MNRFKDIVHDTSDLVLGFLVVLFMISTIGWQLYGWFEPVTADEASKADTNKIKVEDRISNSNEDKKTKEIISFEIKPGDAGIKIAQNLKNLKLIDSTEEFLNELEKSNLGNSMKAGKYEIETGSSTKEIIHILTK